jgi:hypothetical protein
MPHSMKGGSREEKARSREQNTCLTVFQRFKLTCFCLLEQQETRGTRKTFQPDCLVLVSPASSLPLPVLAPCLLSMFVLVLTQPPILPPKNVITDSAHTQEGLSTTIQKRNEKEEEGGTLHRQD